jgi:NAD(P)-dependent dehydrogenase (short-subunit alcohol dehydrogenase family)
VNEVVPGQVETPMMVSAAKEALSNTGDEADYEAVIGRLSPTKSIAAVMAFLASDEAQAVRGAINTT